MFNFLKRLFWRDRNFGVARSPKWKEIRKEWLLTHPTCAMTGTKKKLNVHHIQPVWLFPELELSPTNFITLSEDKLYGVVPHLFLGHHGNYKDFNLNVVENSKMWYNILVNRPDIEQKRKEILKKIEKV